MTAFEPVKLQGRKDAEGDACIWIECPDCGLRSSYKIKNLKDENFRIHARQGQTYYFSHPACENYRMNFSWY